MSIAKQIIEAHGGSIEVASVAQQGTTITCTLPSVADAAADCRPAQGRGNDKEKRR
jgi:signal transduction histidine kinase